MPASPSSVPPWRPPRRAVSRAARPHRRGSGITDVGGAEAFEDLVAEGRGAPLSKRRTLPTTTPAGIFYHLRHHRPSPKGRGADPRPDGLRGQQPHRRPDAGPGARSCLAWWWPRLSHGAGAHALSQVAKGVVSVLADGPGFDEAHCWQLIERHRITNLFTVPDHLDPSGAPPGGRPAVDHASLRHVIYAGAPMYREDQRLALEKLGKVIVQYYGLGEVTGNITVLPAEEHACGRWGDARRLLRLSPHRHGTGHQGPRGPASCRSGRGRERSACAGRRSSPAT